MDPNDTYSPQDKSAMGQGQNPPPYSYPQAPPMAYPTPGQHYVAYPQQPGQPTVITVQPQPPLSPPENDYLCYSIFNLLCCCMPLGIAALIYSIITREANHNGQRAEAQRNSRCARVLNHTALGIGLVAFVLVIIYVIVVMVMAKRH